MQSDAMIRKAAEAIWAIRREEEDRCDMSLDDIGGEDSKVWQEAKAALEAALSAAEPVPVAYRHTLHMELGQTDVEVNTSEKHPFGRPNVDYSPEYRVTTEPLYPAPAVPSVVVKALEWKDMGNGAFESYAMGGALHYKVWKSWQNKWYSCASPGGTPFEKAQDAMGFAQADYEALIRSALSSQEQDVAGWQDISTAPQDGTTFLAIMAKAYSPRATLCKVEDGKFFSQSQGEKFVVPGWNQWWPTHWMPLPAAPAKQEG